jgi:hypothetical protein
VARLWNQPVRKPALGGTPKHSPQAPVLVTENRQVSTGRPLRDRDPDQPVITVPCVAPILAPGLGAYKSGREARGLVSLTARDGFAEANWSLKTQVSTLPCHRFWQDAQIGEAGRTVAIWRIFGENSSANSYAETWIHITIFRFNSLRINYAQTIDSKQP